MKSSNLESYIAKTKYPWVADAPWGGLSEFLTLFQQKEDKAMENKMQSYLPKSLLFFWQY
jgi:hypothetical protein